MQIGKISIRPTKHYWRYHSDVDWDLIVLTVLSPTKILPNKRYGKDRLTYIKKTKNKIIKVHTKKDEYSEVIWVINAFEEEK